MIFKIFLTNICLIFKFLDCKIFSDFIFSLLPDVTNDVFEPNE